MNQILSSEENLSTLELSFFNYKMYSSSIKIWSDPIFSHLQKHSPYDQTDSKCYVFVVSHPFQTHLNSFLLLCIAIFKILFFCHCLYNSPYFIKTFRMLHLCCFASFPGNLKSIPASVQPNVWRTFVFYVDLQPSTTASMFR